MNAILWVIQVLLAAAFFAHGMLFLTPPANMVEALSVFPRPFQVFLGTAEVLAAIGLTLPGITRILPWLVPCAAAGVMIVMIGATILHIARGEVSSAMTTAVLLVLATVVAYMRWKVMPIPPRTPVRTTA
jgi:uncharacterized membrane protein YphA (DoxX/SURF4 family)